MTSHFLVVDDDPDAADGMARLLETDGHTVASFTSGAAAVEALRRERFDAVLTDLEMPRVDGHAVIEAAREHQPRACLVVVSARARDKLRQLLDQGVCIVAVKPLDYDALSREIAECHARGGSRDPGTCVAHARARSTLVSLVRM